MDVREYGKRVIKHWSSYVTGGFCIAVLSVYAGTGHYVPHWVYWVIASVALAVAMFQAWLDEWKQVKVLKEALETSESRVKKLQGELDEVQLKALNKPVGPRPKQYNVKVIGKRLRAIKETYHGSGIYEEAEVVSFSPDHMFAILVDIRNELDPLRHIDVWDGVSASIQFKNASGEVRTIGSGVWLNQNSGYITIERQQDYTLILTMKRRKGWVILGHEQRKAHTDMGIFDIEDRVEHGISLDEDLTAEVLLHDRSGFSKQLGSFPIPAIKESTSLNDLI